MPDVPAERSDVGTLSNIVLGGLADRLTPVLQTPVEDIIYEVLDARGLPTRTEVRDLRNRVERLEQTVAELTDTVEKLQQAQAAAPEAAPAAAAKPAPQAGEGGGKTCKVPDCGGKIRARGFCGAHYQKWNRGTLQGFVYGDGTTLLGEDKIKVPGATSGQRVEVRLDGDDVVIAFPEGGDEQRVALSDARVG